MTVDLNKFKEVFFEESAEGLDTIESILMNHAYNDIHDEQINAIFRAAHSLKGGSATFDYIEIANFTHELETYLDKIRNNQLQLTAEGVDLVLQSVDCLRDMLHAYRHQEPIDTSLSGPFKAQFLRLMHKEDVAVVTPTEITPQFTGPTVWQIEFYPKREFFLTGNEPIRFIRELMTLGELKITVDDAELPSIDAIQPELCYLAWNFELASDCDQQTIESVFDWVTDDCRLSISQKGEIPANPAESTQTLEMPSLVKSNEKNHEKGDKREKKIESSSIRVSVEKMDNLLNMVGELVITQSMLNQIGKSYDPRDIDRLRNGLALLEQNTRELQDSVMRIRMVPISFIFSRIQRVAYDLSKKCGKEVEVEIFGEQTELDKTVMEFLGDPILHLVRNSIDHGIESPEKRVAAGKPAKGKLRLEAYQQGGNIIIEVSDDGGGLNQERIMQKAKSLNLPFNENDEDEVNNLIFHPGFSTAEVVSDISGRGVGMDVVLKNMQGIGGSILVATEKGIGTTFSLQLPLTLAILDGQLCRVGAQIFIIPLISIKESLQVDKSKYKQLGNGQYVYQLREDFILTLKLADAFDIDDSCASIENSLLVVLEAGKQKIGIFVDELLEQQQVVIKSLEDNCKKIAGISGATILGNGTVSLIIDVLGLIHLYKKSINAPAASAELKRVVG